ncbi:MAG: APC family permease [Gaiellaceae bacterium]
MEPRAGRRPLPVTSGASASRPGADRGLPAVLFTGFAVASIGGPIALVSFFPSTAGDGLDSAGLVALLALAVFAVPLGIWLAFSRRIVSPGGLSAFVEHVAGRRAAVAHGWVWAFAYFLYLPYTVTFVVYDLLAPVFPGIQPYRSALELLLPVALVLVALSPVRAVLAALAALAVAQLVAMLVLAWVEFGHVSTPFAAHPSLNGTGRATGGSALLFVCASLPLYLGAEVRGGSRTVRRGLAAAVALVGLVFFVTVLPLSGVPAELRNATVPGAAIGQAYSGRGLAVAVGLLTAGSTLALVVAEYLALGRLLSWLHGPPVRTVIAWAAIPFLALDAISLLDPGRFYADLIKPSLGALFASQLVVFALFPRFRRGPLGLAAALVASAVAGWGLYTLVAGSAAT